MSPLFRNSSSRDREVILHYHFFKCAGTSVEHVLHEHFGKELIRLDQELPFARIFASEVLLELEKNSSVKAVTSHQLRMPVPEKKGYNFIPVLFFRHPLDRIRSVYFFDKNRGPVTPDARMACENNFSDYIRQQIKMNKQAVNFHLKNVTDAWDQETQTLLPIGTDNHLARALEILDALPVVGVVERYSESAKAYENLISSAFPDFKFPVKTSNVGPNRQGNLQNRLETMCEEIGESLYKELEEINYADFALYQAANTHLDSVITRQRDAND